MEKNFVHQQILNSPFFFYFPETVRFGVNDIPVLVNFVMS